MLAMGPHAIAPNSTHASTYGLSGLTEGMSTKPISRRNGAHFSFYFYYQ